MNPLLSPFFYRKDAETLDISVPLRLCGYYRHSDVYCAAGGVGWAIFFTAAA